MGSKAGERPIASLLALDGGISGVYPPTEVELRDGASGKARSRHSEERPGLNTSVDRASDREPGRFREDLQRELLKLLFAMTPVVLMTNLVNGTLIAVIFFRANAPPMVAAWWVFLFIMVAVRGAVHIWHQRHGGSNQRGIHIAIIGSGISGRLWGTAGLCFYSPATDTQRMVLGFVLGGMGAGALTALAPCLPPSMPISSPP